MSFSLQCIFNAIDRAWLFAIFFENGFDGLHAEILFQQSIPRELAYVTPC